MPGVINVAITNLQIFGTKKCPVTRQAERFFKERRITFHLIDIAQKGPSPGELRKIARAVGGVENLIDRAGKRYVDKGLKYAAPTGPAHRAGLDRRSTVAGDPDRARR